MKILGDESTLVPSRQNVFAPASRYVRGPRQRSHRRFPGTIFAFASNVCRRVARVDPLFQRFEIRDRRQCRSLFGNAHKRLYSTPAFYSYVWSIVKRLVRRAKVNVLGRARIAMVFEARPHLFAPGLVLAATRHQSGETYFRPGFAHRLSRPV